MPSLNRYTSRVFLAPLPQKIYVTIYCNVYFWGKRAKHQGLEQKTFFWFFSVLVFRFLYFTFGPFWYWFLNYIFRFFLVLVLEYLFFGIGIGFWFRPFIFSVLVFDTCANTIYLFFFGFGSP